MRCTSCGNPALDGAFCGQCGAHCDPGDRLLGAELGSYRIEKVLGEGGMGKVYLATHPTIGSRVAIKVLSPACAERPDLVERFFAEAKAVNLIRHESIVNVLDLSKLADGRPYIVMEYLAGAPLSTVLRSSAPLPLGSAARLIGEVLGALAAAHQKGIVHRDLKPDNIYVSPQGRAKVLDFGIAKLLPELKGGATPTQTGAILGTPNYMAPEQALGQAVDHRSDLYSLGLILFECVTGKRAFDAASLYEVLHLQVNQPIADPRTVRVDLPAPYAETIVRAAEKDPADRFATAEEFLTALTRATSELIGAAWNPIGSDTSVASAQVSALATPKSSPDHRSGGIATSPTLGGPGSPATTELDPQPTPARSPRRWPMVLGVAGVAALGVVGGGVATGWFSTGGEAVNTAATDHLSADAAFVAAVHRTPEAPTGVNADAAPRATPSDQRAEKEPDEDKKGPRSADSDVQGGTPSQQTDGNQTYIEDAMRRAGMRAIKGLSYDKFDVTGYIKEARRIATAFYSDAVFFRLDAQGVLASGHANLNLQPDDFTVLYRFFSPSRSKRPANLPLGIDHKPNCLVYVYISPKGSWAKVIEGFKCEDPPIPAPSCSMKDVWKWAVTNKGAPANAVASISYFKAGKAAKHSFNIADTEYSFWVPDSCN